MSRRKITITIDGPLLDGSLWHGSERCGKKNCKCMADPPKLHGPYYRWSGTLDGRKTTKALNKEQAKECERRIKRYRKLRDTIDKLLRDGLKHSPWNDGEK